MVTNPWLAGQARVVMPGEADFATYWPVVRRQSDHVERSRSIEELPPVIAAERIVYTEHWLRREGFAPRQFWKRSSVADRR